MMQKRAEGSIPPNIIRTQRDNNSNIPQNMLAQNISVQDDVGRELISTPSNCSLDRVRSSIESNRKRVGFIFLIIIVLLWGGSSFLLQKLFSFVQYSKPLLTTLIQTSLTSMLLLPKLFQKWKASRKSEGDELTNGRANEEQFFDRSSDDGHTIRHPMEHIVTGHDTQSTIPGNSIEVPAPHFNSLSLSLLGHHKIGKLQPSSVLCSWKATIPLGLLWFGKSQNKISWNNDHNCIHKI